MKELVIDRAKWARVMQDGKQPCGFSSLLNSQRTGMCCLGHWLKVQGFNDNALLNKAMPQDVEGVDLSMVSESWIRKATAVNDREELEDYTDAEQEQYLIQHFSKIGWKLSFTGKTPPCSSS